MGAWRPALGVVLVAMAGGSAWAPPPPTEETTAYEVLLDGTIGPPTAFARVWRANPFSWSCNADQKVVFNVYASMAQWVQATVSATNVYWRVLRAGDYAVNAAQITLASNGDVDLHVQDMSPLTNNEGDIIPTKWAITPEMAAERVLHRAPPLPSEWFDEKSAPPSTAPAGGLRAMQKLPPRAPEDEENNSNHVALWNRVTPNGANGAWEYNGHLHLDFVLLEQKPWVDPKTGGFKPHYPPPPPWPPAPASPAS